MTNRSVVVTPSSQPLSYINKDGKEAPLGDVQLEDFEGEGIRKLNFYPAEGNPFTRKSRKFYSLGVASDRFQTVNPASIQSMLLEQGLVMTDQFAQYGGLQMVTHFSNPKIQLEDTISWDRDLWGGEIGSDLRPLISLETSMFQGTTAAKISQGIFRLICTNGAVGPLLGLPTRSYRHYNLNLEEIQRDLLVDGFMFFDQVPTGPQLATGRTLSQALNLLRRVRDEYGREEGPGEDLRSVAHEIQVFTPRVMNAWQLNGYIDCLARLDSTKSEKEPVYTFEVLNAFTSAVNLHRREQKTDRGAFYALSLSESVVKTTHRLCQLVGFFSQN